MSFSIEDLKLFPSHSGVYLMKDKQGLILYIGKAKNLRNRLKQYFSAWGDSRAMVPFLTKQIADIETIVTLDDKEALLLENTLIKKHKPKYNVLLKDDKTYLNLWINPKDRWPRLYLLRSKGKPEGKGLYFGPYTNAFAARQIFDLMARLFPLRQCSDEEFKRRSRPCLLYDMKRCIAPCVQKCSKEEYDLFVKGAIDFLRGHDKSVIKDLYKAMKAASQDLEFEKAAALYQTIQQAEHVLGKGKTVINLSSEDLDILGVYGEGAEVVLVKLIFREGKLLGSEKFSFSGCIQEEEELLTTFILQHYKNIDAFPKAVIVQKELSDAKILEEIFKEDFHKKLRIDNPKRGKFLKSLLKMASENAKAAFLQDKNLTLSQEKNLLDLQEKLHLTRYPKIIECFDTSNISGSDLVACKIRFIDGKRDKAGQRVFKIKGIDKADDYAALHQTLSRRLLRAQAEQDFPDLIIVDGGKGQLGIAERVLKELNIISIDVISLAKENARHDKGMTAERVFTPLHKEPIHFDPRSPLLFLLQNIRDEAHRVAISYHRSKRKERLITSQLDEIPGIGPKKKQKLLQHFGSVAAIKKADREELEKIPGITQKDIEKIVNYL